MLQGDGGVVASVSGQYMLGILDWVRVDVLISIPVDILRPYMYATGLVSLFVL